jgi:hypothetical protein
MRAQVSHESFFLKKEVQVPSAQIFYLAILSCIVGRSSSSEWNPSACRLSPCSLHWKTADQTF